MEFEENMYVRTKEGKINKIFQYNEQENNPLYCTLNCYVTFKGSILKASHNIIDLIEVGDIIKFDITDTDNYAEIQGYNCWEISCEEELNGVKEMIEMESAKLLSIVTKEQFESMQYRIGE